MDKLLASMLGMLSWTFTEAPIRAASLLGRLSRSTQFESVVGAEIGRSVSCIRALVALFSNSNFDVASCSMRCCWELLRGSSQGSASLFMSTLLEESNSQLLKTTISACVHLLSTSNTQLSVQSTLVLNQILAVRDAPQLLAGLMLLKSVCEVCCNIIASREDKVSFHQLPVQLQVGCLRLVLRACSNADCLASIRRNEVFDDLVSQLQQASMASNKQVSSFSTKVVNVLRNESVSEPPVAAVAASQSQLSSALHEASCGQPLPESAAPSAIESVFAHGKALRSAIINQSPSVFLGAAATQAMADEFRATSSLLVQEQARVEELNSRVLLLELELQQKELQTQSLLDESRAVSETLFNADAAIRQLQEDIQIRDAKLIEAVDSTRSELNKDHEISTLRAELQSQRQHCDAFSQEVSRLIHERQELIKDAGEMQQVKAELSTSLASAALLQRQLLERDQLLLTLQQQVSDASIKDVALASANSAIANLERSLRQRVSDLEAATAANAKLQEDLQAREQLLILAHSQSATALETIAAVEAAAGQTQGNDFAQLLSAANQENAALRSRISQLENDLAQQSRESASKVDGVVMQAAEQKITMLQRIDEYENRLQEMSQEIQKLTENRAADLAHFEGKLKLAMDEAAVSAKNEFTVEKSASDSHIQEKLKLSDSTIEDLKTRLRAAEAAILEAAERESLLLAQKSDLDADSASLRQQIDVMHQEKLKLSDSTIEDLKTRLRAAETAILEAAERESLLLAQKSDLDADSASLRQQIADFQAASQAGSQSQWSDYAEKSALESALEEESRTLRAQLESQLVDFQGIMDAKDHIIEQLTEQVKKQQQQLEDAQAVNQVNSNTIISQSSIIGDLQSKIEQLSSSKTADLPAVSLTCFPECSSMCTKIK
jgi:DNA repair exonuclease SbcCD ATPase subunit